MTSIGWLNLGLEATLILENCYILVPENGLAHKWGAHDFKVTFKYTEWLP